MCLIGRVLLLAFCVFSVYSLPQTIKLSKGSTSEEIILNKIEKILHNHFNQTNSNETTNNTNTADQCYNNFIQIHNFINEQSVRNFKSCIRLGDESLENINNRTANSTLFQVNFLSQYIQQRLDVCVGKNSSDVIFRCYLDTIGENLNDLRYLTLLSSLGLDAFSGNSTELVISKRGCVMTSTTISQINSIIAHTYLETCLNNVGNWTVDGGNSTAVKFAP